MVIAHPFPEPPAWVQDVMAVWEVVRGGDPDELERIGDVDDLPRPWDPTSCAGELRYDLWTWCDQVAEWVNQDYAWRPTLMVPACWPKHAHIAQELPTLACLRYAAGRASGPELLEDWHRYALPGFLERMTGRLGEGSCRSGKHNDWPAKPRHQAHLTDEAVEERKTLFFADANPPVPLRPERLRPVSLAPL